MKVRFLGLALLTILCVVASSARSEEDPAPSEAAAGAAMEAHREGNKAAFREVALRTRPGPFVVAAELKMQGADAALLSAFAEAASEAPAGKALPALIKRWLALSEESRARETERHACLRRLSALPSKEALAHLDELDRCLALSPEDADTSVSGALLLRLRASLLYTAGAHDDAIETCGRFLERAKALGAPMLTADALYQSGRPRYMKKDFAGAKRYEQQALALYRTLKDMERIVYLAGSVGMTHFAMGELDEAAALYDEAVALAVKHDLPEGGARAALFLGDTLLKLKKNVEAAEAYRQGAAWSKVIGNARDRLMALVNRGAAFQRANMLAEAAEQYAEALPIVKKAGNVMGEAIINGNLVFCLRRTQQPADALMHARLAVKLYLQVGRADRAAPLALEVALVLLDLGDLQGAIQAAEDAIQIAKSTESKVALGRAQIARANVRGRSGDYDGMFGDAEAAHALALETGDQGLLCEALVKTATAHERRGRYTEALPAAEEALEVAHKMSNRSAIAKASTVLGHLYWALRDFDQARKAYELAAKVYEASGEVDAWLNVLHSLAGMLGEAGQPEEAHTVAKRANAALGAQSSYLRTTGLVVEATTLIKLLRYEEAKTLLLQARAFGDTPQRALIEGNLGYVNRHLKRFEEALPHAREAVALHRKMGERWELAGVLQLVAELSAHTRDHAAAAEAAREAVALRADMARGMAAGDRGLLSPMARTAQDIGLFSLTQLLADKQTATPARLQEALWMAEMGRSLSLLEGLVNRDAILEANVDATLQRGERDAAEAVRVAQKALLGLLEKEGVTKTEIDAATTAFQEAESVRHEAVRQIQRASRRTAALVYPHPIKRKALEAVLAPDEAFLLHHMLPDGSVIAVVVTKRGMLVREVVPYGDADIRPELARFRELVATKGSDDRAVAASLHAQLIAPLASQLDGVRRLLLSPDGELAFLPYEALVTNPTTGARLIDQYEVAYVPSATVLAELRSTKRAAHGSGILALGDPAYGGQAPQAEVLPEQLALRGIGSLGRLPHSGDEVREVAALYGIDNAELLVREDATVQKLSETLAGTERLAALHLACHGIFVQEHAQLSGLVLAGREVLTLEDLFRLRVPADLVVLSACESGQGRIEAGEGVIGLVRGFLFAGAPRVVVSNWNVQDESTKDLMLDMHRRLRGGSRAGKALRDAKRAMRSLATRAHPYYWAPFVLWGLPE